MHSLNTSHFDPHSSLSWKFDALHGYIDIRDAIGANEPGMIIGLLKSPILERLRRVKQLGFASRSYPAADHSRYAHSLGTMHVMRKLLTHLANGPSFSGSFFTGLRECFADFPGGREIEDYDDLVQHLLITALLQDVGELPLSRAIRHFYRPGEELRRSVQNSVGFDISDWSDKNIFTVACLYHDRILTLLDDLSLPFLVFLITGRVRPENKPILNQLKHLIDGVVDADRLDYVFRDAYHTVGSLGAMSGIVESLLYYDKDGPIFSDPAPISNFLAMRARLHSTVYSAPANRFPIVLLVNFLQSVIRKDECAREFFGGSRKGDLSLEDFLELDDVFITSHLDAFASGKTKKFLDQKARNALQLLVAPSVEYQGAWLPPQKRRGRQKAQIDLPDDLFFDTFVDQQRLLYRLGSIRIEAPRFKLYGNPIALEECGGPFTPMFKNDWSMLPMPESILLFIPQKQKGGSWTQFDQALHEGSLYERLIESDPFGPTDFPSDTRRFIGCEGPDIFISFSWTDNMVVRKLATLLYKRRRRYYLFIKPYQGIGKTTTRNSIEAVNDANAVLVLASSSYVRRFREAPDGNIAKEISTMRRRTRSREGLRIVVLSVDSYQQIRDKRLWPQIGFDDVPFVGKPLKHASDNDFDEAIDEALKIIDTDSN